MVFRELANYEPKSVATTIDDAHRQTIQLLEACRQGWAERLGPLGQVSAAA